MLDREYWEWFRPRPGRCGTCVHHLVVITEEEDFDCWCEIEEEQRLGWLPGMHLDHCAFPAAPGESCASWVKLELPGEDAEDN